MTYVLENVSQEDRLKINGEVEIYPQLVARFSKWGVLNNPANSFIWAIDRNSGNYFFRSIAFPRELDHEYHFLYEGKWFVIAYSMFNGKPNSISVFTYSYADMDDIPVQMKDELVEIFSVYGLHGYGPNGSSGTEGGMYRVVPTFKR